MSHDKDILQDDHPPVMPVRINLMLTVDEIMKLERYCLIMQNTNDQAVSRIVKQWLGKI